MKFTILILAVLMLIRPVVPVLEYAINYDYISTVLCVNKFSPEKKCNGKCHLKENLESVFDDTSSSNSPKSFIPIEVIVMFAQHLPSFDFTCDIYPDEPERIAIHERMHMVAYSSRYFHPPTLLV